LTINEASGIINLILITMKKFGKFVSFFSICLILSVILGNFSLPVLAYEKNGVSFEQISAKTKLNNNSAASRKIKSAAIQKEKGEDYVDGEVLVKYKNNKINLSVLKIKDAKTVEQKIAELKNDPNIEYAEPNYRRYTSAIDTDDANRGLLWGLDNTGQSVNGVAGADDADIDASEAWAISEAITSTPVIVAVIDTGVAYNHPDLLANMWDGSSCKDENGLAIAGGCNHGYDYEDNDNTPLPSNSPHGTHVAGTIAAIKNNGKGVIGVAPQAKIMAIKFGLDVASEVKAIDFAIQNGAKIINASFVGASFSQPEFDAINRFQTAGGIFVATAGNGGADKIGDNNENNHQYPSDYNLDNIISAAATDQNDNRAGFSNYSATSVDVGAPGVNIYSALSQEDAVLFETFEDVTPPALPSDWVADGVNNNWGTWDLNDDFWGKVLYGDIATPYASSSDTTIASPTYNLIAGGANIDFWTQCDTEYSTSSWTDYMALEFSSDNGSNFTQVLQWDEAILDYYNGENPLNSTDAAVYHFENINIPSQYLTNDFKFRLRWLANGNADTGDGDSCLVDDIKITKFSDGSDEKYGYLNGTSMAAPHVAGLAALLWGAKPSLTYTDVKNSILNTGDPLPSLAGKTTSGKRINAFNAIDSVTMPIISNIQTATTTLTSTIITWSTNEPATSKIAYSTATPVSSTIISTSTLITSHRIELTGLSTSTTYYFYIETADKYGNIATSAEQSFKTLSIPDITPPVITLNGSSTIDIFVGDTYVDAGATATDDIDGDITANIVVVNLISTSTVGAYTVTYNVSDTAGNPAIQVTRTVNVNSIPDTTLPVITLISGNMTIYQGSTYIDTGATALDNVDGNITANIVVVNPVSATSTAGAYAITYDVSDTAGNHAIEITRTVNVLAVASSAQLLSDNTMVSASAPEILVDDNNTASSVITIPNNVTNATINVSALTTSTATSVTATIQGAITINASTTIGAINVEIPANIQITAGTSTWNGIINVPQIKENSAVTATPDSGNTAAVSAVIEIGFGNTLLSFDKAVRIKITGQAGKYAGYSRNGVFTPIINVCSADLQAIGDALAAGGDCKISVGSDLIIWTKHFTNFVTYTQTAIPPASSGGGGGGGGGGGYTPPTIPTLNKKADINGDNKVDKYDFSLMMANWGKLGSNTCDLNNDNKVDKYDFALLMSKWGL